MLELFMSLEFWVALLTGGVVVKLIDHLFPALLNRQKNAIALESSEKDDLRRDIEYLRKQVDGLRKEVTELRVQIESKDKEIASWQRKYWSKKLALDRVLLQVKHYGTDEVHARVLDVIGEDEQFD